MFLTLSSVHNAPSIRRTTWGDTDPTTSTGNSSSATLSRRSGLLRMTQGVASATDTATGSALRVVTARGIAPDRRPRGTRPSVATVLRWRSSPRRSTRRWTRSRPCSPRLVLALALALAPTSASGGVAPGRRTAMSPHGAIARIASQPSDTRGTHRAW